MFLSAQIALRLWLAVVSLGAAASLSMAIRSPQGPPPLRIGFCDWPGSECLLLADHLGYFAEEGVEVDLFNFHSLTETRRAFERGQLHGAWGTLVELLQTYDHTERRPPVAYAATFSQGADVILGRPPLRTVADLRGRRVGVEVASLSMYLLSRALELSGLSLGDVELIQLDAAEMEAAFAAGEVDAVVTYPPFAGRMLADGAARRLFDSREIPDEVIDLIYFDETLLRERPDAVRRLLRAYDRAVQFVQDHPETALPIMAERLGMEQDELHHALTQGIHLRRYGEQAQLLADDGPLARAADRIHRQLAAIGQIRPQPQFKLPVHRLTAP